MKIHAPVAFSLVAVLIVGGCAQPDPLEEAAMQASRVGTHVGETDRALTTAGLDAGSRIAEEFYFVAKYQATLEQRQQAEAIAKRVTPKVKAKRKSGGAAAKKASRYIAVPTKPDGRAKTKTSVMIWDTQSEEIVGNDVYDLNAAPPSGAVVRFETYSAEFVAAGI